MKLSELFPDMPKIFIGGVEYEVKFNTRAMLQLESDYPEQQEIGRVINSAMSGMKVGDLINMLFAGLIHTKAFKDKELLIDAIEPKDFSGYADAIMVAWVGASMTPEQIEKLEVMAASEGSKKKRTGQHDYAGDFAFFRIYCGLSKEEYFNATKRELVALNIGYCEMNGMKTEWDDPGEFFWE